MTTATTIGATPQALKHLGFLHIAPFAPEDPGAGLNGALELFRFAEDLGFDSGWLRTRHMQYGATAPGTMLAALSQVTSRLQLGSAVIPLEFENPFSLAEHLGMADVLSGGRLRPGLSVHPPRFAQEVNDTVFGPGWREEDYGYDRILKLRRLLEGEAVRELAEYTGFGGDYDSRTVQPLSPGLSRRLSYGAGSLASATWAGRHDLGLLVSNISSTEKGIRAFDEAQAAQIAAYRQALPAGAAGRVAQARVVVPVDGADEDRRARYRAYVQARTPRTTKVLGERTIIAADRIGTTEEIVEALLADPSYRAADEFIVELPFELDAQDWRHILTQWATRIGPALGWRPQRAAARAGEVLRDGT